MLESRRDRSIRGMLGVRRWFLEEVSLRDELEKRDIIEGLNESLRDKMKIDNRGWRDKID